MTIIAYATTSTYDIVSCSSIFSNAPLNSLSKLLLYCQQFMHTTLSIPYTYSQYYYFIYLFIFIYLDNFKCLYFIVIFN